MKRFIAGGLVAAGAVSSASGQCNLYRHGIPDFDQVRTGLPNMGNMYCVPTSAMNLLGYVANRGVPSVLFGSRNWQSDSNHAFITGQILTMGVLMGTDPIDGTTGGYLGLRAYLHAAAPGKFVVNQYYGDFSVASLVSRFALGGLVNVCYGHYERQSSGRYDRDGGHCITLSGIIDFCEPTYRIRWRDPASGGISSSSQSTFVSASSSASSQFFVDGDGDLRNLVRLWEVGDDQTRRYLDSITTMTPLVAISGSVTTSDALVIRRSVYPAGFNAPSNGAAIPGGNPVTQIVMDPQQIEAFAVTFQDSTHIYRVWRHNLATGASTQILSSEVPVKLATSRFGDLYVMMGSTVRKYGVGTEAATLLQETQSPAPVDAAAYDDMRDELVVVTTNDRIVRFQNNLDAPAINFPLPQGVTTPGAASIAIDEVNQKYYICGSDAAQIHVVGLIPGSPAPVIDSEVFLPAVQHPEALQFTDDATLILLNGGVIAEFGLTDLGWQPLKDSAFAGLPGAGALVVGRSRSNFVAGVHDAPEWSNILVDEGLVETPDCTADFNQDGLVTSQDFFDYLTRFFDNDLVSDFNFNGVVTSQDFFDFLAAFFNGCD